MKRSNSLQAARLRLIATLLAAILLMGMGASPAAGEEKKSFEELQREFDAVWSKVNSPLAQGEAAATSNVKAAQALEGLDGLVSVRKARHDRAASSRNRGLRPKRPTTGPARLHTMSDPLSRTRGPTVVSRLPSASPGSQPAETSASQPTAESTATTRPAGMQLDANRLPDISDDQLEALRAKFRARRGKTTTKPARSEPIEPEPIEPGTIKPEPVQPPPVAKRPGDRSSAKPPTSAPAKPGKGTVAKTTPEPKTDEKPADKKPDVVPVDPKTNLPDLKLEGWWKLLPEERQYFFTWKDTQFINACHDLEEMSGLSMIGFSKEDKAELEQKITFQSVRLMSYDDALTTFNEIAFEVGTGFWVVNRDNYLVIRRLTEWYRHIPPARMYGSYEQYRKAKLPKWEVVSAIYEPENASPSVLAARATDKVPLNGARAVVVPGTNRIELTGFVYYIDIQLELIKSWDEPPDDGRILRAYTLKYATLEDAAQQLLALLPTTAVFNITTPTPQPTPRGRRDAKTPTPATPQSVGDSPADLIDIQRDTRANRLLIKATPAKHELIAEYLEEWIDVQMDVTAKTDTIELQYADPAKVIESVRPLLIEQRVVQPPTPPATAKNQNPKPPPPQTITIQSAATMMPIPGSMKILVKASADEMAQIKQYVMIFDVEEDADKPQFVRLKHGKAGEIASFLNETLSSEQQSSYSRYHYRRSGPTPVPTQKKPFTAVAVPTDDKALIIKGEPQDIEDAKELIAQLDVDPESGSSRHLVRLNSGIPSELVQTLSGLFSTGGSSSGYGSRYSYSRHSRYSAPTPTTQLPRFIPNDTSGTLFVVCRDENWPEINKTIEEIDSDKSGEKETKLYRLKHASADALVTVLTGALNPRGAMRRSWMMMDLSGPSFTADRQTNTLIVSASEEMHVKAEQLIKEMDQPGPAEAGGFKAIELTHADPEYVTSKLQELFGDGGGYRGYRSYGAPQKAPFTVVAESVSNRVLVQASEEDFARAKEFAEAIDKEYGAKDFTRKIFTLQHISAAEAQMAIQSLFGSGGSGGRRSYYGYGMPPSEMAGGVKVIATQTGLIVHAPSEKMKEIESVIADLDADPVGENEVRIYQVKGVGREGTATIARTLEGLYGGGTSSRYDRYRGGSTGAGVRFFGEYGSDVLFVSATKDRIDDIDKKVQEYLKTRVSMDLTMQLKHFDVKEADAQDIADMVEPILETKYDELREASGGSRSYYGGARPQIAPHTTSNRLMVVAPDALMPLVEELIEQFDQPAKPSVMRIVTLKTAKAEETAPIIEAQMSRTGGSFGSSNYMSRSRYYPSSYYGRSSRSSDANELRITVVESSNAIILRGPEEKVSEAEDLIHALDEQAQAETLVFKVFKIEHSDLFDLAMMVEEMVPSDSLIGKRSGTAPIPLMVKTDYASSQLIVYGPPEKMPIVEQIVIQMEQIGSDQMAALGDTGMRGEVISKDKNSITKTYEVTGSPKRVAEYLEKALLALIGFDAPYVKASPFGKEIVVTGDPKHFHMVDKWLEKIEKNPPKARMMIMVRRVKDPTRLLGQLQHSVSDDLRNSMNIKVMPRLSVKPDPLKMIGEIDYDTPLKSESEKGSSSGSPFVPPNTLEDLRQRLSALTWAQPGKVTSTQPAATSTQPAAVAPSAAAAEKQAPKKAVPTKPPAKKVPAKPSAPKTAVQAPAQTSSPPAGPSAQNQQSRTQAELYGAFLEAGATEQTQIRYDEKKGDIIIIGPESQIAEIQELMDRLIEEYEKIDETTEDVTIRVFQVNYVDVNVAAAILEQMFNGPKSSVPKTADKSKAKTPKKAEATKKEKGEEESESAGAKRRREEQEEEKKRLEEASQLALGGRIRVSPYPPTQTLIIGAAPDLFPSIAELILKIDRPGDKPPVNIKMFQLKRLNAYEVEQALKAILKIEDRSRGRSSRDALASSGRLSSRSQARLIEDLEERMLELQASVIGGEGAEGTLKLNPAKEISITSNATTNTIIVSAPEGGMKLVEDLIKDLEDQEIPIQIKTVQLENGDAETVATQLEKIFRSSRGQAGGRRGGEDGVTPSRMGDVTISALAQTNSLVIRALEPDMEKILPIVEELDQPEPLGREIKLYTVKHGDATEIASTLSSTFSESGGKQAKTIRITADAGTNTVVVRAPIAKQEIIAQQIEQLDKLVGKEAAPRQLQLTVGNASNVAQKLAEIFAPRGRSGRGARQRVNIVPASDGKTLFVTAPDELFEQIKKIAGQMDTQPSMDIQMFSLKHAAASDVLKEFKELMAQALKQLKSGGMTEVPAVTADDRTNSLLVLGSPAIFTVVEKVLLQVDVPASEKIEQVTAMFSLTTGNATSVTSSINSLYQGQKFSGGVQAPRAVADRDANVVYVYGTKDQIAEIKEEIIDPLEMEVKEVVRPVQVYALTNTDSASVYGVIRTAFATPANAAEVDRVDVIYERTTNSVVVTASPEKREKIAQMIKELDQESTNVPQQWIIPLKDAQAEDLATVLTATYHSSNRSRSGKVPITITAGPNGSSLVVSAGEEDFQGIKKLVEELDKPASEDFEEVRFIPLEFLDADETLKMMSEVLRRPAGSRSRRGGSDLVGGIRLQASQALNALVVSGSKADVDRVETLVQGMDQDVKGAGTEPRMVALENASAPQLATTLSKMFTEPAQKTLGRKNPEAVPLILADEGTNKLMVRARPNDFNLIEQMAHKLDTKDSRLSGIEIIPVKRSMDVNRLASEIEATINRGEQLRVRSDRTYIPKQVAIGVEERLPALIVAGSPEMFETVKKLVTTLQGFGPPDSGRQSRVIPVRNVSATEMKKIVQQLIERKQSGGRRR